MRGSLKKFLVFVLILILLASGITLIFAKQRTVIGTYK